MEIKDLSGREICAIIKSCKDSDVRELKIGSMQISFGKTSQGEPKTAPLEGTPTPSPAVVETTQDQKTEQQESFVDAIKSRMNEEILQTQTLMDDPVQYEEELVAAFHAEEQRDGENVT